MHHRFTCPNLVCILFSCLINTRICGECPDLEVEMNSIRSEHVRLSQSFNLQPLISSKKNPFSERNLFVITLFWDLSG